MMSTAVFSEAGLSLAAPPSTNIAGSLAETQLTLTGLIVHSLARLSR